jgi:hypothetical protein
VFGQVILILRLLVPESSEVVFFVIVIIINEASNHALALGLLQRHVCLRIWDFSLLRIVGRIARRGCKRARGRYKRHS